MDQPVVQTASFSAAAILWPAFYVILGISILFSVVYYYHWGRYAPTHFAAITATIVYTAGIVLLLISLLSIVTTL